MPDELGNTCDRARLHGHTGCYAAANSHGPIFGVGKRLLRFQNCCTNCCTIASQNAMKRTKTTRHRLSFLGRKTTPFREWI
jgi:hypothetical protein